MFHQKENSGIFDFKKINILQKTVRVYLLMNNTVILTKSQKFCNIWYMIVCSIYTFWLKEFKL